MDCLTLHAVTAILEKADLLRCLMRNAYLKRLHRPGIHLSQPESARERGRARGRGHAHAFISNSLMSFEVLT